MPDGGQLRLGVAGLGVASTLFLPASSPAPTADRCCRRPTYFSAEGFQDRYGARTYESVEALCGDPDVDVVWVATPNQYHCEHVVLAAEHKKHVICTKPMALSIAEAERMCLAAEQNGVQLLCGQTWSMSPDVQAMWQVVASGRLGRLIAINTWFSTDWLLKPRMPEELDEALGGGVLYRHSPHLIDTVAATRWGARSQCPWFGWALDEGPSLSREFLCLSRVRRRYSRDYCI